VSPVAKFLVPFCGDKVDYGIGLSYRPASLCSLTGKEKLSQRLQFYKGNGLFKITEFKWYRQKKRLLGHGKQSDYNRKNRRKEPNYIHADSESQYVQYDVVYMTNLASISM
jgi:hypothetical protein